MTLRPATARSVFAQLAFALLVTGCSNAGEAPDGGPADDAGAAAGFAGFPAIDARYPHGGIPLAIAALEPPAGSPSGGEVVRVRGQGFAAGVTVTIAGEPVDVLEEPPANDREVWIRMPAHAPGSVDVTVGAGEAAAVLADGYVYWPFDLDPRSGSIAGGTRLWLGAPEGEAFEARSVQVGDGECRELARSDAGWFCVTPGVESARAVDVLLTLRDGRALRAPGAFAYVDEAQWRMEPGLHGEALDTRFEVTAWSDTERFEGAFVWVEDSEGQHFGGRTDARGKWAIDDPALRAPLDLHVFAECAESMSIFGVDRALAAVTLNRIPLRPECALGGGQPPVVRGSSGGVVSGHVAIAGGWDSLPKPVGKERRVVHLGTTRSRLLTPNPSPDTGEAISVIAEDEATDAHALHFRIFTRTGSMAVYALAGLETDEPDSFVPYAMGVARGVAVAPAEARNGVMIRVDIELNHGLDVALDGLPELAAGDSIDVIAAIDLGSEGVLVRQVGMREYDRVQHGLSHPARFAFRPGSAPELADARLRVRAQRGSYELPYVRVEQLFAIDEAEVRLDDALGIPEWSLEPEERRVSWVLPEGPEVQLLIVDDVLPAWTILAPGRTRSITLPDPSLIDERLSDPLRSRGKLQWRGFDGPAYEPYASVMPPSSGLGRSSGSHLDLPLFAPGTP